MQNTQYHFGVSIDEMDQTSKKVYEDLIKGIPKKEIANRYKVPMTVVNCISKRFRTGQKTVQIKPAIQVYENISKKEEDNTVNTEPIKKRKRLSRENVNTVIQLIAENPDTTLKEIAEIADTTVSSVSCIKQRHQDEINKIRESSTDTISPKKENKIPDNNNIFLRLNIRKYVTVGLVAERHEMPVDEFIFKQAISKKLMFDYNKLDRICKEFIQENINFDENGNAIENLVVYVTGIQCVLSSLIKVTNKMHVNLTLRHFNADTGTYFKQVIWNEFGQNDVPDEIEDILVNCKNSFAYKCKLEDLIKNKKLIKVSTVFYKNKKSNDIDHVDVILCSSIDDAFECMKKQMHDLKNVVVYSNEYTMESDSKFYESGIEMRLQSSN